jgi:replicative DNA helicase
MNPEQYLCGAILISGEAVMKAIRGIVTPDCFQLEAYRAIYVAGLSLLDAGEPIDPVSIKAQAKRQGVELSNKLLSELMEVVPSAAYCVEYAHRVAEDARTRAVKELAERIQSDTVSSADELLATLQRETEAIRGSSYQRGLLTPNDTLHRFMDYVVRAGEKRDNFISTGFPRLDDILGGGFIRGGLYILGARPAVGKSTFGINLADNIAGNVLFVSLEMSVEQITAKRISRRIGCSSARLLSGQLSDQAWEKVAMASSDISQRGLYLNNRYDLTVQQIALLAQAVPELRAVIVDYLGLIQPATRSASTYENISQISRELKRMALSLNVPVICLCQLSRQVESRQNKRPMLSDLRDSGAIEQDADGVLFLYRDDYYAGGPADGQPSAVDLSVAKNRHGQTGETSFNLWLKYSYFKEAAG